jgi:RNA polymerase sigma-70 factor (ECF subfamily)
MSEPTWEFSDFYAQAYQGLVAQLTVVTGSLSEAQDCVQEAMFRAWLRWERIGAYADPAGWVRRVALNLSVSRWRRLKRLIPLSGAAERAVSDADWGGAQRDLVDALRRIPKRRRQALVLHYVLDLPIDQVAREMGIRPGTVKSMLSRGRHELAIVLAGSKTGREG